MESFLANENAVSRAIEEGTVLLLELLHATNKNAQKRQNMYKNRFIMRLFNKFICLFHLFFVPLQPQR